MTKASSAVHLFPQAYLAVQFAPVTILFLSSGQGDSKNHCFGAKKCVHQYKNPNRFRLLTMAYTFFDYEAIIFRLSSTKGLKQDTTIYTFTQDICFRYTFVFKRIPTQAIMLLFVPSILIVILSWISFWLDVKLAAPRVALGLTSLLTLATQFNSAEKDLPSVATIKALDIWMFMCIFMVFASLLVYAISYSSDQLKVLQTTIPLKHAYDYRKHLRKLPEALAKPVHENRSKYLIV
uniref:Neurotransmitter-gated ion-channel transmembrane domain-containing protein n=1 Tax=Strigamia maritima TaxID=126957 RepID=T1J032_STRMM